MHSKNRPLQAPRPAGGFARRVPLLSESEKARPNASAPGLCPALQSAAARFLRKPSCMSCTATAGCVCGGILHAGVFSLAVKEQKSMPKRFYTGTLPQRYNPPRPCFFRKPRRHAIYSYDQMYPWQYFAPGSPLAIKEQKRIPSASAPGLCPALQSAAALLLQKTTPECHVQLRPDVSAAIILRAGVSPRYQRAKNHTQAPLRQDFAQRYNPPRSVSSKNRPACHVQLRPDVSAAIFYAPGLPLAIRERKIIPKRFYTGTLPQCYNPPRPVSPENRPACHVQL